MEQSQENDSYYFLSQLLSLYLKERRLQPYGLYEMQALILLDLSAASLQLQTQQRRQLQHKREHVKLYYLRINSNRHNEVHVNLLYSQLHRLLGFNDSFNLFNLLFRSDNTLFGLLLPLVLGLLSKKSIFKCKAI